MLLELSAPPRRRAINLTPLIDVVFILLLFFMLTSVFTKARQIDASAPSADAHAETLIIPVRLTTAGNRVMIGEINVDVSDIDALTGVISAQPDAAYAITIEGPADTQSMINVMDALKAAGADKVALAGVAP